MTDDATLWLNLGDSYANVGKWGGSSGGWHAHELHGNTGIGRGQRNFGVLKPKDLIGIPWMVAFALRDKIGFYLRQEIIWHKPNPLPESVKDRCTKAHEQIFLLTKSQRYYFDAAAIAEPVTAGYNGSSFNRGKTHAAQSARAAVSVLPRVERSSRNKRSVWTAAEPIYRMRADLTPEQRAYVLRRIAGVDRPRSADSD